ncbi:MAG: hypothetical protein EA373_03805 [Oceanospirillales bacterium]|nr:MAG: hypothetical protein EA373_03805 [Oceanospirillales bacterium]
MNDQDDDLDVTAVYDSLKLQFIDGVSSRLSRLWDLYQEISRDDKSISLALIKSLHFELHKLNGASGSYELSGLEHSARDLESLVWSDLQEIKKGIEIKIPIDDYYIRLKAIEDAYYALAGKDK